MSWVLKTLVALLPGFKAFAAKTTNEVDDAVCIVLEMLLADNGSKAPMIKDALQERGFLSPKGKKFDDVG